MCLAAKPITASDPDGDDNIYGVWDKKQNKTIWYSVAAKGNFNRIHTCATIRKGANMNKLKDSDFIVDCGIVTELPNKGFKYDPKTNTYVPETPAKTVSNKSVTKNSK